MTELCPMDKWKETVYFTIGDVAEILDIATSKIRFWENEYTWLIPGLNKLGHRQYNRKQVNEVLKVHFLLNKCRKTMPGLIEARAFGFYDKMISFYEDNLGAPCKQI